MPQAETTTENAVSAAVVKYLQKQGWIADRVAVGMYYTIDKRPIRIGKPGQPDWRFKHAKLGYLEVEMKRPGERPRGHQLEYIATMQAFGFAVTWADSLEMFKQWYGEHYPAAAV